VEGLLAEPLIPSDLAAKVRTLLDDPAARRRMGEAARRRAEERYALPVVVGKLVALYRSVVDGTPLTGGSDRAATG